MTPIDHAACGLAAGAIMAPAIKKIFKVPFRSQYIVAMIAALFPDIDAASLLFSHAIYYGKEWYSHHFFFHSFAAAGLMSFLFACIYLCGAITIRGIRNLTRRDKIPLEHRVFKFFGMFIVSFSCYCVHFLGDLPTPPGPWNGIAMYWPSNQMVGGWSKINWHNWYIIYLSISFLVFFIPTAIVAGIFSSVKSKYAQWISNIIRTATVLLAMHFIYQTYTYIDNNNFKEMGAAKWDSLNRSLIPKEYMKNADEYFGKSTVFWRKELFNRDDFIKMGNAILASMESFHEFLSPKLSLVLPSSSFEKDMIFYRWLQSISTGMDDLQEGDFRVWYIRDSLPSGDFFNKGFILYYDSIIDKFYLQMTNSWMILFKIEERDSDGNAVRVRKIIHTSKVFVPDTQWPQLNQEKLSNRVFNFWDYERTAYNLIPRRVYSRFMNTIHGFFPSTTREASMAFGKKTGLAFHDGLYSEGCTVHTFGHFDIGAHLENPFYPLWRSADSIIDTNVLGSKFRGNQRSWGKAYFIKDPNSLPLLAKE